MSWGTEVMSWGTEVMSWGTEVVSWGTVSILLWSLLHADSLLCRHLLPCHWQPSGVHCRMKASPLLSHSVWSFAASVQFSVLPRCLWISSVQRFVGPPRLRLPWPVSTLWGHAPNCHSYEPHAQPISIFVPWWLSTTRGVRTFRLLSS